MQAAQAAEASSPAVEGPEKDEEEAPKSDARLCVQKKSLKRSPAKRTRRVTRRAMPPRMAVQSATPDWRGFVPVIGPMLYVLESLKDAVHGFFGAGTDEAGGRTVVRTEGP